MLSRKRMLIAALVGALGGLATPAKPPTQQAKDKKKRTRDDVQSRKDKNAAKRARRAARYHQQGK